MRSDVIMGSVVIHQAYQEIHDFKIFSANGQLICRNIKDSWEREWGGDEQGTYPPALPKWERGLLRDRFVPSPFGDG